MLLVPTCHYYLYGYFYIDSLTLLPFRYSEENCYLLMKKLLLATGSHHSISEVFCVFVSNTSKSVAIWEQLSRPPSSDIPVVWDYHVIVVAISAGGVPYIFGELLFTVKLLSCIISLSF